MPDESSFVELMRRLHARDAGAATTVFTRYARRLVELARHKLYDRLNGKVDGDDIVQSVYRTFFRRHAAGEFEIKQEEDLWRLLALITVRKCGRWREHFQAAKLDVRREITPEFSSDESVYRWEAAGEEPTPVEAATLAETLQRIMESLPSEVHRQVLSLQLQGYTPTEISDRVRRTAATVRRILAGLRDQIERQLSRDAS